MSNVIGMNLNTSNFLFLSVKLINDSGLVKTLCSDKVVRTCFVILVNKSL